MSENRAAPLREFVDWCGKHITGDEKGQAQIFIDHLFVALGHAGCLDVGGGIAFADYVWKPHVLIEMKKRGADLNRHYRQVTGSNSRRRIQRPVDTGRRGGHRLPMAAVQRRRTLSRRHPHNPSQL